MEKKMPTENNQPTQEQILASRFEAVKVVTAVAERVLLSEYERQIIINSCVLSLQTIKQEFDRVSSTTEQEGVAEVNDSEDSSEVEEDIDISFEEDA